MGMADICVFRHLSYRRNTPGLHTPFDLVRLNPLVFRKNARAVLRRSPEIPEIHLNLIPNLYFPLILLRKQLLNPWEL